PFDAATTNDLLHQALKLRLARFLWRPQICFIKNDVEWLSRGATVELIQKRQHEPALCRFRRHAAKGNDAALGRSGYRLAKQGAGVLAKWYVAVLASEDGNGKGWRFSIAAHPQPPPHIERVNNNDARPVLKKTLNGCSCG